MDEPKRLTELKTANRNRDFSKITCEPYFLMGFGECWELLAPVVEAADTLTEYFLTPEGELPRADVLASYAAILRNKLAAMRHA